MPALSVRCVRSWCSAACWPAVSRGTGRSRAHSFLRCCSACITPIWSSFFYAFALGLLLSYAYYRTGLLRTSVLLHMLFNIIGSVVPMLLPDTIAAQSALGLFWMAMLVIGIILLVRGRKQQVWLHGPCAPSLKAVLQNAGMFLLIVACFVQTVFNYL